MELQVIFSELGAEYCIDLEFVVDFLKIEPVAMILFALTCGITVIPKDKKERKTDFSWHTWLVKWFYIPKSGLIYWDLNSHLYQARI